MLITVDKNMRYQQNFKDRKFAFVAVSTPQGPMIRLHLKKIATTVDAAYTGSEVEIEIA